MADEGLDIDRLNTVILATPKINIIQAVGRVMRKVLQHGDIKPLIIDIQDEYSVFKNQGSKRIKQYLDSKYNINTYYLEKDKLISYRDYKKKECNFTDAELDEYLDKDCDYDANWDSILDIDKVNKEDTNTLDNIEKVFNIEHIKNSTLSDFENSDSEDEVDDKEEIIEKPNFNSFLFDSD